jgi:hypothetical protein
MGYGGGIFFVFIIVIDVYHSRFVLLECYILAVCDLEFFLSCDVFLLEL